MGSAALHHASVLIAYHCLHFFVRNNVIDSRLYQYCAMRHS